MRRQSQSGRLRMRHRRASFGSRASALAQNPAGLTLRLSGRGISDASTKTPQLPSHEEHAPRARCAPRGEHRPMRELRGAHAAPSRVPPLRRVPRQAARQRRGIGRAVPVKIALDAMGGDLAPKANVEGAVAAARDFGIEVVLVGNQAMLEKELAESGGGKLPISIVHASETVEMSDSPIESVLGKPNSSMHVGYEMLKRGEADAFLSAGNSGAMMTAAMVVLGNLPGVDRPAIASMVPNGGDGTVLIDAGANVEVK